MLNEFDGFEWDPNKSDRSFEKHGIDFETAAQLFDEAYLEEQSLGVDYGEPRFKVIGLIDDAVTVVVWTPRGSKMPHNLGAARQTGRKKRVL